MGTGFANRDALFKIQYYVMEKRTKIYKTAIQVIFSNLSLFFNYLLIITSNSSFKYVVLSGKSGGDARFCKMCKALLIC